MTIIGIPASQRLSKLHAVAVSTGYQPQRNSYTPKNQNLLLSFFCIPFVLSLDHIILHECCLCDEKGQKVILRNFPVRRQSIDSGLPVDECSLVLSF